MFRRALFATAVTLALAAPGAVLSPTAADGGGSLTSSDVVLYDCVDQPFDYALDVPADTTYWAL
ncbi:MAG: hypothetical protein ACXVW4_09385, partial [Nocardioides sp.]